MRKSILLIFVAVLVLVFASPSIARDPVGIFPQVLIDASCTDSYDVPAASVRTPFVPQSSGSPDGLCDGDTKVLTGSLAADTALGPLGSKTFQNAILYIDADTVTGGATTWRICVNILQPWSESTFSLVLGCTQTLTGTNTDGYIGLGTMFVNSTDDDLTAPIVQPLPIRFKVVVDLLTATAWAGSIGFHPVFGGGG
jgi:hypothetical protein